jgi:hypothetical protein
MSFCNNPDNQTRMKNQNQRIAHQSRMQDRITLSEKETPKLIQATVQHRNQSKTMHRKKSDQRQKSIE